MQVLARRDIYFAKGKHKKRTRHEEETRDDKRHKRHKKGPSKPAINRIESMKQPQITISDDSSLFSSKTVIISRYTLILTLDQQVDVRAGELSDELKKMRRQNLIKRMMRMNQCARLSADDMFSYKYDIDTPDQESYERITFFTLIKSQTHQERDILINQATSRNLVFLTNEQSRLILTLTIFDLKNFVLELKDNSYMRT